MARVDLSYQGGDPVQGELGQLGHRRVGSAPVVEADDVAVDLAERRDIPAEQCWHVVADHVRDLVDGRGAGQPLGQGRRTADRRVGEPAVLVVAGAAQPDHPGRGHDDGHDPQQEPAEVMVDRTGIFDLHRQDPARDRDVGGHTSGGRWVADRQDRVAVSDAEPDVGGDVGGDPRRQLAGQICRGGDPDELGVAVADQVERLEHHQPCPPPGVHTSEGRSTELSGAVRRGGQGGVGSEDTTRLEPVERGGVVVRSWVGAPTHRGQAYLPGVGGDGGHPHQRPGLTHRGQVRRVPVQGALRDGPVGLDQRRGAAHRHHQVVGVALDGAEHGLDRF